MTCLFGFWVLPERHFVEVSQAQVGNPNWRLWLSKWYYKLPNSFFFNTALLAGPALIAPHCFNGNVQVPCKVSFLLDLINKYSICDQIYDQKELVILLGASGYKRHMFFYYSNWMINRNNIDVIIVINKCWDADLQH